MVVSPPCMSEADRFSLEALRSIHQVMDDDQDGGIEVEESVEFIIEDMKQQQTNKHSHLHREDQHITVEELWRGWKSSEVHNWTQDDVLRWLKEFVELPQYQKNFKDFKVNGNTLPRIAANEPSFLSGHLRVQDQRDKQKLNIKALDVVLFGPPTRPPHNYMKDLLLIVSIVMGVGGCWFARVQNKASKVHIGKMMKDLESLQSAEQSLFDLQEQLERAQEEKRNVAEEKHHLEEKMRDEIMGAQEEAYRLQELRQGAVSELSRLRYAEEELEQVRGALKQAENDMQASWSASEALQQWMQLTHEVEVQYFSVKRHSAELQLTTAKEEAEKIKKKRSSVLGTLHVAHSSSLDQVDHKILEAKNSLSDVTACLRERLHRWQHMERLCGFPIIRNVGLAALTAQLYSDSLGSRAPQPPCSCHSPLHGSIEDLIEEGSSTILTQMSGPPMKRSPRTRGSTICRSRRPAVMAPHPPTMISADPDLLIPARAPYPCYEEEERHFPPSLKKQDSQEKFSDSENMLPPPHSKLYPGPITVDASSRKHYRDDSDLLADGSIRKTSSKEGEVESPVRKFSVEELEASFDVANRRTVKEKALDPSMEAPSVKMAKEDPLMDAASRKTARARSDVSVDSAGRKVEPDASAEHPARKVERDTMGVLIDTTSRNLYRDRGDLSLDTTGKKFLWNDLEAATDVARRKISRDMMGVSMDSISRKTIREEPELQFDTVSRKMSLDADLRKAAWEKGELESNMCAMPREKIVEAAATPPRKLPRGELEYGADVLSSRKIDAGVETSSCRATDKQEFGPATSRRIFRDDLEMPAGSLRRRIPRDYIDTCIDTPTGKISWDRVDVTMETPKQRILREELAASELSSSLGRIGQPDLTASSLGPWRQSAEFYSMDRMSQLVYDGILEKSCRPPSLSVSTPNLPQSSLLGEAEPLLPPPRHHHAVPSPLTTPESGDEKYKEKEKSKKSLKLKNLFKKKHEPNPEKPQSGLQKL
ncbi:uncharacterized protein LOC142994742 [Genypterus blacodes]|uniref:uncharacterized protein LOC142994742 n=1 Tax=Genypterus blacodes TaxID=154954 RepID=UPI003F7613A4